MQPPEPVSGPDGDKLASIAARFSYFQEKRQALAAKVDLRRNINPPARYKNARPTVRLRPRQVLCSKCRSICNENSENVDVSKKRKHESQPEPTAMPTRRSDRRCVQQPASSPQKSQRRLLSDSPKMRASLIPKLSRLQPNEMSAGEFSNFEKEFFDSDDKNVYDNDDENVYNNDDNIFRSDESCFQSMLE